MFTRLLFVAFLCGLHFVVKAQRNDTLNLNYPSDFFYHPGDSLKIYLETDLNPGKLNIRRDEAGAFKYNQANKLITFHSAPGDLLEKLVYVTYGADTLDVISFIPTTKAEKRPGFSRYNVSKILDESAYQKIDIDSSGGTKRLKINGRKLLFANNRANLFYQFSFKKGQSNTIYKHVEIGADTLIIQDPIHFPGANLRISARVLIIEYKGLLPVVNITPLKNERVLPVALHQKGADGINADTLQVCYDKLVNRGGAKVLFAANGGDGQNAPLGKNGIAYPSLLEVSSIIKLTGADPTAFGCRNIVEDAAPDKTDARSRDLVWIDYNYKSHKKGGSGLHGTDWDQTCTSLGSNNNYNSVFSVFNLSQAAPIQGGRPGEPGKGGIIISNAGVNQFSNASGGFAGKTDSIRSSGKISGPVQPYKFVRTANYESGKMKQNTAVFEKLDYPDKIILQPFEPVNSNGMPGSISISSDKNAWANIDYVCLTVDYANDLLRFGHVEEAEFLLSQYKESLFTQQAGHSSNTNQSMFNVLSKTVDDDLLKIRSNLDYYGNAYGFVPGLELTTNYAVYKKMIQNLTKTYSSVLYLEKQIQSDDKDYKTAVSEIESYLNSSIAYETDIQDIENVQLPYLEAKIDTTISYMENVSKRVMELEIKLKKQAKQTIDRKERAAKRKDMIKGIATLAKVVPVGQPALGLGASIFEAVALKEDGSNFFDQVSSVVTDYKQIKDSKASFDKFKSKVDFALTNSPSDLPVYKKLYNNRDTLSKYMEPFIANTAKVLKTLKLEPVSKESVASEIAKLKVRNPEYNSLIDSVQKLTELNKDLLNGLLTLQLKVRKLDNDIVNNGKLVDMLKENLSTTSLLSDDKATTFSVFKKDVLDKLNYYQYLYAKAYEYFTLSQYKGYENTFFFLKGDRINSYKNYQELINNIGQLYNKDADESAESAFEILNTNPALVGKTTRLPIRLLKADIDKLNSGEELKLNFFRDSKYNVLINEMGNNEDFLLEKITVRPVFNPTSVSKVSSLTFSQSTITIAHQGTATRYRDDSQFNFHHTSVNGVPFYEWTFDRSFLNNKLVEREADKSYLGLVNMITEKPIQKLKKVVSFDSDFKIYKKDSNPDRIPVLLDSLELSFHFILLPRRQFNSVYMNSPTGSDLKIPLSIIAEGSVFKGDGIIYKSFKKDSMIKLVCPKYWQDKTFTHWFINGQKVLADNILNYKVKDKISVVTPVYL